MGVLSIGEVLLATTRRLRVANCDAPEMEADYLLAHVLGVTRSRLLALRSQPMDPNNAAQLEVLVVRREQREPLAYIIGYTEFYGRSFYVEPGVLIPRVDTECLIDVTLGLIDNEPESEAQILELGVGSGCIVCSLLAERMRARAVASDFYPTPLKVASRNAESLKVQDRLVLHRGSWFDALPHSLAGSFDVIVSNPPYVERDEAESLQAEVRDHEPHEALFSVGDTLDSYGVILEGASRWLKPSGHVVLELGAGQDEEVSKIARDFGYRDINTHDDTAGIARVLVARPM